MSIAAFVTAAGLSSRMGEFKPLLQIGNIPAAEHIILSFRAAGIKDIAVVSGYNAAELEGKLKHLGLVFLRNEQYENTEMFDSVKIALEYLKNRYSKIAFSPVDVPLFKPETVKLLLQSEAPVTVPVFRGKKGHPIVMDGKAVIQILNYPGNGGLRGAMENLSLDVAYVEVDDPGILYDIDNQDDYNKIVKMYNEN